MRQITQKQILWKFYSRERDADAERRTRNAERRTRFGFPGDAWSENLIGRCSRRRVLRLAPRRFTFKDPEWKTLFQDDLTVNRYCTYPYPQPQPLLGANKFKSLTVTHSRASFPLTPQLGSRRLHGGVRKGQPVDHECMVIKHAVAYVIVAQSA